MAVFGDVLQRRLSRPLLLGNLVQVWVDTARRVGNLHVEHPQNSHTGWHLVIFFCFLHSLQATTVQLVNEVVFCTFLVLAFAIFGDRKNCPGQLGDK